MKSNKKKLLIGFLTYDSKDGNYKTSKYLPYFLRSLFGQVFDDFSVFVADNSDREHNENVNYLRKRYPEIENKWSGGNIGFARANNIIIKKAHEVGAEYIMFLNPDTIMEPDAALKMIRIMDSDANLGSVSAKIKQWDFINNKKNDTIDSCGIIIKPGLRFYDLGQARVDKGQFDKGEILGPSGTAPMYRISALEKVRSGDQYFDELMFMYKEDCDLAYRLKQAGYKSKLVPDAIIYHDRSVAGAGESNMQIAINRKTKSRWSKELSFLNQHIIFIKYWKTQSLYEKINLLWYAFKIFVFVLLFEQFLMGQYKKIWQIRGKIKN